MTERTSDAEDHADYAGDARPEPPGGRPGPSGAAAREQTPDVAESTQEPPD